MISWKESFSLAKEVPSFDSTNYMASFDLESLFKNIPLEETINICVGKLFHNETKVNNCTVAICNKRRIL